MGLATGRVVTVTSGDAAQEKGAGHGAKWALSAPDPTVLLGGLWRGRGGVGAGSTLPLASGGYYRAVPWSLPFCHEGRAETTAAGQATNSALDGR